MAAKAGISLIVPDLANQRLVMNAIYGERGVKAGCTDGQCRQDLLEALGHLVARGARAVILGCTELPPDPGRIRQLPRGGHGLRRAGPHWPSWPASA